jgi:hypothetical protein
MDSNLYKREIINLGSLIYVFAIIILFTIRLLLLCIGT